MPRLLDIAADLANITTAFLTGWLAVGNARRTK